MEAGGVALRIVLLGICVIMLLISVQAMRRTGGRRMTFVMLSFLGFTVLSALALLGEVMNEPSISLPESMVLLLLVIIGANYLALLKG